MSVVSLTSRFANVQCWNVMPCTRISVSCVNFSLNLFLANPAKERRFKRQHHKLIKQRNDDWDCFRLHSVHNKNIWVWSATVHQLRANQLFVSRQRYFSAVFVGTAFYLSLLLCRRMQHKGQLWEWITKGNTRIKCAQMRANACFGTRFLTRVCAKIVRAFCVCVGRLSLTCTVIALFLSSFWCTTFIFLLMHFAAK